MKITFFSFRNYEQPYYQFSDFDCSFFPVTLNFENKLLAEGSEIISCFVNDKLDRPVLEHLASKGLKLIALRCAGFNNVDLNAARELSVSVVRVPAYSPHAVAEHAVALLLSLNRKIHKAYNRVRENNFSIDGLTGFDVHGTKVGVVGTGRIGQAFCRILLGFGAEVFAYDPFPDEALVKAGVTYLTQEALFSSCKVISLHLPLTDQSKHMVNEKSIQLLQKGVFLINTSRGALIDTRAVIDGLKSGKIGALGLDVYEEEEGIFFVDHSADILNDDDLARLMTFHNVLITSHQAFLTSNALANIADTTLKSIDAFRSGSVMDNQL